uniref:CSON007407 protein n=1 Tax=Culicoides sonorensis TaxID=179676 RepID=A0A336K004_CULSO
MNSSRKKIRYGFRNEIMKKESERSNETHINEKLMEKEYQIRLETRLTADWKRKQIAAETDNYRNHLRENLMSSNLVTHLTSPIVENAGIMQAIQQFGLVLRGNQAVNDNTVSQQSTENNVCTISQDIDEFAVTTAINRKGLGL